MLHEGGLFWRAAGGEVMARLLFTDPGKVRQVGVGVGRAQLLAGGGSQGAAVGPTLVGTASAVLAGVCPLAGCAVAVRSAMVTAMGGRVVPMRIGNVDLLVETVTLPGSEQTSGRLERVGERVVDGHAGSAHAQRRLRHRTTSGRP